MLFLPSELTLLVYCCVLLYSSSSSSSLLVSAAPTATEDKPSIWQFNIFRGPAPPPDSPLSPPGAAGALRDKSKLKYEIIGIAGAYLVWVLLTLSLILFVGLKLRRRAQSSNPTLNMEMLKTGNGLRVDEKAPLPSPGPLSPGKLASLKSWAQGNKHRKTSSNVTTTSTIDTRLVEEDRQKNMDEMAKLYAHVMAHEQERESMKATSSAGTSPSSPTNYHGGWNAQTQPHAQYPPMPTPPKSPHSPREHRDEYVDQNQNPPELQYLRQQDPDPSESPYYYPPSQQQAPVDDMSRATTRVNETPRSFSSRHERTGSSNSNKLRPSRISVRGKSISEPIGDADLSQSFGDDEATPLSPRLYTPGPAPPTPKQRPAATGLPTSPRLPNHTPAPPVPIVDREVIRRRQTPSMLAFTRADPESPADSLPFRQIYKETGLSSAPYTKTTFVHAREDIIGRHPRTGVPQTPYSPYMPMTPMTPVTPSMLVTKKDMKRQRKKEGLKVLSEDDMVRSDDEMWGS